MAARAGSFAVQLAAAPAASQVAEEWQRLTVQFPQLGELQLQAPQVVEVTGKGTFYRVLAGPFPTKAAAEATCAELRKAGGTCRLARP